MSYFGFRPYVSVAQKRRQAETELAKLRKRGRPITPVAIKGRTIATTFWGQSWCTNLERYSDFATRLPRGRTYVRNGSVVDLQIAKGEIAALVSGSELYETKITIAPVATRRWQAICRDCAGTIDSLVELLQGRLAKGVMDRVCQQDDGLFPAPAEIKLSCSCPDWADMCKHVAAVLYGVGARLDERPQLLFVLRGVDENDLLAGTGPDLTLSKSAPSTAKVLDDGDVAALFGLEMAESGNSSIAIPAAAKPPRRSKTSRGRKPSVQTKALATNKRDQTRRIPARQKPRAIAARKSRAQRRTRPQDT
jgi:uncharacterized Zn finger protein